MSKTKNGAIKNGAAAKAAAITAEAIEAATGAKTPDLAGIVISDDERSKLAELESEALRYKVALADADMQMARMESARNELREKVAAASKAYIDSVMSAAGAHGIDLNDKSVRWNFDTSKMTFTRAA